MVWIQGRITTHPYREVLGDGECPVLSEWETQTFDDFIRSDTFRKVTDGGIGPI